MSKIIVRSPEEMEKFAAAVAQNLHGGETLALTGELGAGKTAFVKGLAKALGVTVEVQSPTFLLMKCYEGKRLRLCHVDAYRVKDARELLNVGVQEYIGDPSSITAVEWADLAKGLMPANALWIRFEHGKAMDERIVSLISNI